MVHPGQGLALGFEARDHFARIHAGFDQLESHTTAHRPFPFGEPNFAHAAFTDYLQQVIATDHRAPSDSDEPTVREGAASRLSAFAGNSSLVI
jgi:hypothetical protein